MLLQGVEDSVSRLSRPRYFIATPNLVYITFAWTYRKIYHFGCDTFRFGKRSDETDQRKSDIEAFVRLQGADKQRGHTVILEYFNIKE